MTHPARWVGDRPVDEAVVGHIEPAVEEEPEPRRGRDAAAFIGSLIASLLLLSLVAG